MAPIVKYIIEEKLPVDKKEVRRIKCQFPTFIMAYGILYKRKYSLPYLRCISQEIGAESLKRAHEGLCGDHSNGIKLAKKVTRQGFYWPLSTNQAVDYVIKCDKCQKFSKFPRLPPTELTSISSSWPFNVWGIDLIGPLPVSKGGAKYTMVSIDYFTKWVNAEPLPSIISGKVPKFVIKISLPNSEFHVR